MRLRRLGEAHDRLRRHRYLMAQVEPVRLAGLAVDVGQAGLPPVADEEEITERLDAGTLLAFAEQCGDQEIEMLAEQIEQRALHRGHRMDGDAEVEGLLAAAAGVAVGEGLAHRGQDVVAGADGLADDQVAGIFQRLADLLTARHLADTGVAGIVGEDDEVAGEERRVRAAQIEEHAVAAGDRDHFHRRDDGGAGKAAADRVLNHLLLPSLFVVRLIPRPAGSSPAAASPPVPRARQSPVR